jgi:hypothetical protein
LERGRARDGKGRKDHDQGSPHVVCGVEREGLAKQPLELEYGKSILENRTKKLNGEALLENHPLDSLLTSFSASFLC